jgi:hypothetical protein
MVTCDEVVLLFVTEPAATKPISAAAAAAAAAATGSASASASALASASASASASAAYGVYGSGQFDDTYADSINANAEADTAIDADEGDGKHPNRLPLYGNNARTLRSTGNSKRLVGFKRLRSVRAGATVHVEFTLEPGDLAVADEQGTFKERPGMYQVHAGLALASSSVGGVAVAFSQSALHVN